MVCYFFFTFFCCFIYFSLKIGVFLTDLVAIEESQPTFKNNLISIAKLKLLGNVIGNIEGCKKGTYDITPIPSLQAYLLSTPSYSTEKQRNLSLTLEPIE